MRRSAARGTPCGAAKLAWRDGLENGLSASFEELLRRESRKQMPEHGNGPGPARLMAGAKAGPVLTVEVLTGAMKMMKPDWLLLQLQRRPAGSFPLEVDGHLNAVGSFDERNAAVHPVVLTVEGHCPFNRA